VRYTTFTLLRVNREVATPYQIKITRNFGKKSVSPQGTAGKLVINAGFQPICPQKMRGRQEKKLARGRDTDPKVSLRPAPH